MSTKMYAQSVFIYRVMHVLRTGVVVGLRETIHDYDDETGEYVSIVVEDMQFKRTGRRIMYKDATTQIWRTLLDPFTFLLHILYGGGVEEAYVVRDGIETTIWTEYYGWMHASKMHHLLVSKEILRIPPSSWSQDKKEQSLKCMSAMVMFNEVGPLKMKEIKHFMDYEVQSYIFRPVVWWIAM